MSNNGIPPLNDWQEDNYPVIYDEGNETSYYVKNGNKNEIASGSLGYSVYVAKWTQAGTSNPVVTTIGSNTIGDIVWTRDDVGVYNGTLSAAFPEGKTIIMPFSASSTGVYQPLFGGFYEILRSSNNLIILYCYEDLSAFTPKEISACLFGASITFEIRVYP